MLTARNTDPDTSAEAAAAVDKVKYQAMIEAALAGKTDGLIIDQISQTVGVDRQTLSPRMVELERQGRVRRVAIGISDTGRIQYLKRTGFAGKSQQVWFPA